MNRYESWVDHVDSARDAGVESMRLGWMYRRRLRRYRSDLSIFPLYLLAILPKLAEVGRTERREYYFGGAKMKFRVKMINFGLVRSPLRSLRLK